MTASAVHASCDERLMDSVSSLKYAVKLMPWPDNLDVADFSRSLSSFLNIAKSSGIVLSTEVMNDIDQTLASPDLDQIKWYALVDRNFKHLNLHWPAMSKVTGREITSEENYNGGLWTMFHHIVVSTNIDPDIVANAIKDFVQRFILCSTCRNHFLRMWDFYDNGRKKNWGPNDADALTLWIWRAHNAATLSIAMGNDPEATDFEFWPSPELCPTCSNVNPTTATRLLVESETVSLMMSVLYPHSQGVSNYGIPRWRESEVLKILKSEYRCGTIEEIKSLYSSQSSYEYFFIGSMVILAVGVMLWCWKKRGCLFFQRFGRRRSGCYSGIALVSPNVKDSVLPTYAPINPSVRDPSSPTSPLHSRLGVGVRVYD